MSWNCRPYQPGDERGIADLYREVFQLELTLPQWRWFSQSSPDGPAAIAVMETGGRLVGHYAVQPRGFWFQQRRSLAGIAMGAMLLPEARSVPALSKLAKLAYEISASRGVSWLYAFPKDQSHAVHCKLLGWQAMPKIVEWDGPLPSSESASPELAAGKIQVWRQMPGDLEFDHLHPSTGDLSICGLRSADWLRWRFFDKPDAEYVMHTFAADKKVLAYAVVKRYQRDAVHYGHLLDWRADPAAANCADALLASVWRHMAHDWQVQRVSAWAKGRSELGAALAKSGLTLTGRSSNFCFLDLTETYSSQLAEDSAWQLEMADSDIY